MNNVVFFLLIFLITFLLTNPLLYKAVGVLIPSGFENGIPKFGTGIIIALLVSLIIVIMVMSQNKKENFFFEVDEPQPKCQGKGYYGKPVGFEFTQPGTQDCPNC